MPSRPVLYIGQTQLMSRMGALPLSFDIQAATLAEALEKFAEAANQSLMETMQKVEEMRREQASSLIVPDAGGFPGGGLGGRRWWWPAAHALNPTGRPGWPSRAADAFCVTERQFSSAPFT